MFNPSQCLLPALHLREGQDKLRGENLNTKYDIFYSISFSGNVGICFETLYESTHVHSDVHQVTLPSVSHVTV